MNRCRQTRLPGKSRMRLRSFFIVALPLAILLGLFLHSGNARATGPESLETNGDVLRATLKNGLRVVIDPNTLAPFERPVMTARILPPRKPKH